jgi:hypothetical protein
VFAGEGADDETDIAAIAAAEKGQKVFIDLTCCSLISLPASETMPAETKPAEGTIFAQGWIVLFLCFVCRACCGDIRGGIAR